MTTTLEWHSGPTVKDLPIEDGNYLFYMHWRGGILHTDYPELMTARLKGGVWDDWVARHREYINSYAKIEKPTVWEYT